MSGDAGDAGIDTSIPITLGGTAVPSGGSSSEGSVVDPSQYTLAATVPPGAADPGYTTTVGITEPQNYVDQNAPQGLNATGSQSPDAQTASPYSVANVINYLTGQPPDQTGQETPGQAIAAAETAAKNDPNSWWNKLTGSITQLEIILGALAVVVVVGAVLWYVPKPKPTASA